MGHGIAVDRFERELRERPVGAGEGVRVLHVGRITAIKHCETIVDAVELLRSRLRKPVSLTFIGAPVTPVDEKYAQRLVTLVRQRNLEGMVGFTGSVRNSDLPLMYARADLTINATPDGGLDKAVIESMAAGVPVLTSNGGFRPVFGNDAHALVFHQGDSEDLAAKAAALLWDKDLPALCRRLHATAKEKYDVRGLILRMCDILQANT
jgi:glycosyltransferase involved in cell wall biosynthesis